jgi:hypothetical protein
VYVFSFTVIVIFDILCFYMGGYEYLCIYYLFIIDSGSGEETHTHAACEPSRGGGVPVECSHNAEEREWPTKRRSK